MRLVAHYRELQSGAEPSGVAAAKRFDNERSVAAKDDAATSRPGYTMAIVIEQERS